MKIYIVALFALCLLFGCANSDEKNSKPKVVATTTMIADLARQIGGDSIEVKALMGSGVDPHLYKASEGDVTKLYTADLILYNGLHLEGKMGEIFEQMESQNKKTAALAESLSKDKLLESEFFASNYDPHIWFDISYWQLIGEALLEKLKEIDPESTAYYQNNFTLYKAELQALESEVKATIATLAPEKRILVTAHDAFNYFGKAYGFQVVGLQGLSTATEAGVQDVQQLAQFIIDNQVKAVFVETSVPQRTIEALQAAVASKNFNVSIGGTLYSDALGSEATPEAEYIGMFRANVLTIVNALK
jgi:manganese/zinc/iron transport system substrate-binding protein